MVDLKGRDFLKLLDYSTEEIIYLIELAIKFKELKHKGIPHADLKGKGLYCGTGVNSMTIGY